MKAWFEQLSAREQQAVLGAGVVLSLFLFYVAAWYPLTRENSRLEREVEETAGELSWMRSAAIEARALARGEEKDAVRDTRSLIARVTAELRADRIEATQVRPEGEERLRLTLEGVPFTRLLVPLARLEDRYGVHVREAVVEPGAAEGLVDVRVLVERGAD